MTRKQFFASLVGAGTLGAAATSAGAKLGCEAGARDFDLERVLADVAQEKGAVDVREFHIKNFAPCGIPFDCEHCGEDVPANAWPCPVQLFDMVTTGNRIVCAKCYERFLGWPHRLQRRDAPIAIAPTLLVDDAGLSVINQAGNTIQVMDWNCLDEMRERYGPSASRGDRAPRWMLMELTA